MMMIVLIAASKRQIPIRCNGHITDDDTREVKSMSARQVKQVGIVQVCPMYSTATVIYRARQ